MAIDALALAAALRLGDGTTALIEPELGIITRLHGMATAIVEERAPAAPATVKDEAIVRLAGYAFDAPTAGRGQTFANMFVNSGAGALLAPWIVQRIGAASA